MSSRFVIRSAGEAGFTLVETLLALALTGLVLSALASITSQWLPNWNRGIDRIQRNESVSLALQLIGADLAAAEYVSANRGQSQPLFDGSELSVTFVRTTLGPNASPGLDVIRIGETTDRRDLVTVRSRAPFGPSAPESSLAEQIQFGDPVVLLRPPYRLSFSYAGPDLVWKSSWHEAEKLPAAISLTVRDAAEIILPASTVATIHAGAPATVGCQQSGNGCKGKADSNNAQDTRNNSQDDSGPVVATPAQGRSQ